MKKLILIIAIMLTGCTSSEILQTAPVAIADKENTYALYYAQENRELHPFEPESGCMIGAQIINDAFIDGNIEEFERLTGQEHAIYSRPMKARDPLPLKWLLSCYGKNKTPMITLYPQSQNNAYELDDIRIAAQILSTFSMPIILQFYPNPNTYGGSSEKYISFYKEARKIFKTTAPKVAFVWSISPGLANQGTAYYPGDDAMDYIGLSLYIPSGDNAIAAKEQLSAFCYTWQSKNPLIIFPAVSHYSTKTITYTEQESAETLQILYNEITKYPQIKAVIYIDENLGSGAPVKAPRENYLLTDNQKMLSTYKDAINHPFFSVTKDIEETEEIKQTEQTEQQWLKSPFDALEQNGRLFIPVNTVKYDLNETMLVNIHQIHGKQYISKDAFSRYKIIKKDNNIYLSPYTP